MLPFSTLSWKVVREAKEQILRCAQDDKEEGEGMTGG
jgi:hypothetical protein